MSRYLLCAPLLCAGISRAQVPEVVVHTGEHHSGEKVTHVNAVAVDDSGSWYARIHRQDVPGFAIVRDGEILLASSLILPATPELPATQFGSTFGFVDVHDRAQIVSVAGRAPLGPPPPAPRGGLFLGVTSLVWTGLAPGAPFSGSARYESFGLVRSNRAGQVLGSCFVDDPDPALRGQALQLFDVSVSGTVQNVRTISHQGAILPSGETIAAVSPTMLDLNRGGEVLYGAFIASFTGGGGEANALLVDDRIIAHAGGAGPVQGSSWFNFDGADVNDEGDWVARGRLQVGSTAHLAVATEDRIVAKTGDSVPAIAPATFRGFRVCPFNCGSHALFDQSQPRLSSSGETFFLADYGDAATATAGAGLFLEQDMIVGSDRGIRGLGYDAVIESIGNGLEGGFLVSPAGRFVLFDASVEPAASAGNVQAVCLLDLGGIEASSACPVSSAKLRRERGFALPGQRLELALESQASARSRSLLLLTDRSGNAGDACDPRLVLASANAFLLPSASTALSAVGKRTTFALEIPDDPRLAGLGIHVQGLLIDSPTRSVELSNALRIEIGIP